MSLKPGAVFAGFTVERVLGTGGMGTVYLARQPRLQRRVALKVLAETFGMNPKTRAAFDREAALAAGLDHPNIISVYDRSAADDPALWLTMRYIDGGDAATLLSANPGGLDPARAVRIVADAAQALDYAHAHGVLHRDVKPANLLIENDQHRGERAVLTDFGIARTLDDTVTLSGIAASFAYAAPERFTNALSDHSADIYSLGCTLFQLLTGQTPFARKDQAAVVGAHLTAPPPAPRDLRPELPADLDAVIATALAKAPRDRYPSCIALAEAAAHALCSPTAATRAELPRPVAIPDGPGQVADTSTTTVHEVLSLVPLYIDPNPPRPVARSAHPVAKARVSTRRQRIAAGAGALLAAAGLTIVVLFATRPNSGAANRTTLSTVVPQQITPSAVSIRHTGPSALPPPSEATLATAEQPTEQPQPTAAAEPPTKHSQSTVTATAPRNYIPTLAPSAVPQTRSFQWTG